MRAKKELQTNAQLLRKHGYSYTEISDKLGVSKSSVSLWCHNVPITPHTANRLRKISLDGRAKGREKWADMRRVQKKNFLEQVAIETKKDIGVLSKRDRFIAGLMLYSGEGDKTQERIGMSNTNPKILKFMMNWWEEFLGLDRTRFYAHLYLHVGLSEPRAKAFWAKALRIKKDQIKYVYRPIPHVSRKKNVHEFGVCAVRMHDVASHRRLMGWVRAVLDQ